MNDEQRRDFSKQMNRSHGSFELVVSPFLLGLAGFWLDTKLGLTPVLTIAFSVTAVVGAVIKLYFGYTDSMKALNAERDAKTPAATHVPTASAAPIRAAVERAA